MIYLLIFQCCSTRLPIRLYSLFSTFINAFNTLWLSSDPEKFNAYLAIINGYLWNSLCNHLRPDLSEKLSMYLILSDTRIHQYIKHCNINIFMLCYPAIIENFSLKVAEFEDFHFADACVSWRVVCRKCPVQGVVCHSFQSPTQFICPQIVGTSATASLSRNEHCPFPSKRCL